MPASCKTIAAIVIFVDPQLRCFSCFGIRSASPYDSLTARSHCASRWSASAAGIDGWKVVAASSVSLPWRTQSSVQNPVAMPEEHAAGNCCQFFEFVQHNIFKLDHMPQQTQQRHAPACKADDTVCDMKAVAFVQSLIFAGRLVRLLQSRECQSIVTNMALDLVCLPAAKAAPMAVVSMYRGRSTGT